MSKYFPLLHLQRKIDQNRSAGQKAQLIESDCRISTSTGFWMFFGAFFPENMSFPSGLSSSTARYSNRSI